MILPYLFILWNDLKCMIVNPLSSFCNKSFLEQRSFINDVIINFENVFHAQLGFDVCNDFLLHNFCDLLTASETLFEMHLIIMKALHTFRNTSLKLIRRRRKLNLIPNRWLLLVPARANYFDIGVECDFVQFSNWIIKKKRLAISAIDHNMSSIRCNLGFEPSRSYAENLYFCGFGLFFQVFTGCVLHRW